MKTELQDSTGGEIQDDLIFFKKKEEEERETKRKEGYRTKKEKNAHFSLFNVVLSIVLLIVLRTKPIASLTSISSLYSCLRRLCAVPLLAPMHVAFQPE